MLSTEGSENSRAPQVLEEVNTNIDATARKPEGPEEPPEQHVSSRLSLDMLVIKIDSPWKGWFDFVMLIVSCQNIFSNSYYSAFGLPTSMTFNYIDIFIELLFVCDLIFCFCQEYLDDTTYTIEKEFKKIAKHYLKQTFLIDFIACLPITNLFTNPSENTRLWRLLKLLRMPRLAQLLDVEKVKSII